MNTRALLIEAIEGRISQLHKLQDECVFDVEEIRFQGGIDELEELISYIKESSLFD